MVVTMSWLTATEYLCPKRPLTCSPCRNHNAFFSLFMTYHWLCNKSNTKGATTGEELLTIQEQHSSSRFYWCSWYSICNVVWTVLLIIVCHFVYDHCVVCHYIGIFKLYLDVNSFMVKSYTYIKFRITNV